MTTNQYTIYSDIDRRVRLEVDESGYNRDNIRLLLLREGQPSTGINIPAYHMVNALRGLGHLPETEAEKKLRRIDLLVRENDFAMSSRVHKGIQAILHPQPPFVPPTKLGAVVEAMGGDELCTFVRIGPEEAIGQKWYRVGAGTLYTDQLLNNYRNHKVVSE